MTAVESMSAALPVFVVEALSAVDKLEDVIKLSSAFCSDGWMWLVCGRHLFIWSFESSQAELKQCYQLTLAPSGLTPKAQLVTVYSTEAVSSGSSRKEKAKRSRSLSCIAVSPEGVVRYWANAAHSNSYTEVNVDLFGQECSRLIALPNLGFLLATTTCTLCFLQVLPKTVANAAISPVQITQLKTVQGYMAGVGRRLSSLFWSSQTTTENKLMKVTANSSLNGGVDVFALTSRSFQRWKIDSAESYKMDWETDLSRAVVEICLEEIWELRLPQAKSEYRPSIRVWLVDLVQRDKNFYVLVGALNQAVSRDICFAVASCTGSMEGVNVARLTLTNFKQPFDVEREDELNDFANISLLVPGSDLSTFFVYDSNSVYCFHDRGLSVVPTGLSQLSRVNPTERDLASSPADADISHYTESLLNMSSSEDKSEQLHAAFLFYVQSNIAEARRLLGLLLAGSPSRRSIGGPLASKQSLDSLVVELSTKIIDDYVAADSRWKKALPTEVSFASASGGSSLLLLYQLEDKRKTHEYLVSFLKALGLWNELTAAADLDGRVLPTTILLREHAEKLQACIALQSLPNLRERKILQDAIERVISQRQDQKFPELSNSDIFFRRVSALQELIGALIASQTRFLQIHASEQAERFAGVSEVNLILTTTLRDALKFRKQRAAAYLPAALEHRDYVPWTSAGDVKPHLASQHALSLREAYADAPDVRQQAQLTNQIVELISIQLEDFAYMGELGQSFAKERFALINPLVERKQFDVAEHLASQFEDFDILIEISEHSADPQKLEKFAVEFANKGFADYVARWCLKNDKPGRLISNPVGPVDDLRQFLHGRDDLLWLLELKNGNYSVASRTLSKLAAEEKLLAKKKAMLSISKLNALASDDRAEDVQPLIEEINTELDLISYQENLPVDVLEAAGVEHSTMRQFSAEELIELYVSDANANETSFKIALELLFRFLYLKLTPDEFLRLKQHIWAKVILSNEWKEFTADDVSEPLSDGIRYTAFVRLMDMLYQEDSSFLSLKLPTASDLLASEELSELLRDHVVAFLLKAAIESVTRSRGDKRMLRKVLMDQSQLALHSEQTSPERSRSQREDPLDQEDMIQQSMDETEIFSS